MAKLLTEIHPGEILLEDFMKPLGITARQLSADIDVPPNRVSEIVNGNRSITPDTALRLISSSITILMSFPFRIMT
jgi:addiction module HigA family antidote